jgi:acyl dehydratase
MSSSLDAPTATWPRGIPRVGATASRSRVVEPADIERFTAISGDRNPIHYDHEATATCYAYRLPPVDRTIR